MKRRQYTLKKTENGNWYQLSDDPRVAVCADLTDEMFQLPYSVNSITLLLQDREPKSEYVVIRQPEDYLVDIDSEIEIYAFKKDWDMGRYLLSNVRNRLINDGFDTNQSIYARRLKWK